jgi:hypothetical protein
VGNFINIILLCDEIKEPGIPLAEVLQFYSEESSPDTWKHDLLKFPDKSKLFLQVFYRRVIGVTNYHAHVAKSSETDSFLPGLKPNEPFIIKNESDIDTLVLHLQQISKCLRKDWKHGRVILH